MPAKSERQRRAACAEISRRKQGQKGGKQKPLGTASKKAVREFCKSKRS